MVNLQKTVLMIQVSEHQESIWYAALTSQKISVLRESSNADLQQIIAQARDVGKLPDLLLIDTGIPNLNPYIFCRSYRDQHLNLKIVLTNGRHNKVTSAERRWAIYQGAQDLLPGFQQETLLEEGVTSLNRVLKVLGCLPLEQQTLKSILLPLISSSVASAQEAIFTEQNKSYSAQKTALVSPTPEPTSQASTSLKRKGHSYRL